MLRIFRISWILIFIILAGAFAEEESVDLDNLDNSSVNTNAPALPALMPEGLKFNLYVDMVAMAGSMKTLTKLDSASNDILSNKNFFTFAQDHVQVMASVKYKDKVTVSADLDKNFFEIGYAFTPDIRVKFGKIFVPFGEFDFHHIYGGMVDQNSAFLPKFWCDYGLALSFPVLDFSRATVYAVNGFPENKFLPVFQTSPNDNNLSKSVGAYYRIDPLSWLTWSFSAYYDIFSDKDYYTDFVLFYGSDISLRWQKFEAKAGFIIGEVRSPDAYFNTGLIFDDTYIRYAYYLEGDYRFLDDWKLRVRFGEMCPNSIVSNQNNQYDLNAGVVWSVKPFEITAAYYVNWQKYHNQPGKPLVNQPGEALNDSQMLFLKVLLTI